MKPRFIPPIAACVLSLTLFLPASVLGQTSPAAQAATAKVLFDRATDDMAKKDYAAACKKLEEVVRLVPDALGAKMKLGECYEAQGKNSSAWSQYIVAEALAVKQQQEDRAQKATERAAALEGLLSMLTIDVPVEVRKTAGLAITRDGVAIGEGQWGTPVPVDAGTHEVTASAPGRRTWTKQVEVSGDRLKLSVTVQPLVAEAVTSNSNEAEVTVPSRLWQRPLGIGAAVAGGAGLLLGGLMGGLSMWKRDASNDGFCDPHNLCEPQGTVLRNEALALGNASTVAFVVGGVLAGAGIVLFVSAPRDKSVPSGKSAEVRVLPGGVSVAGRF